MLLAKEKIFYLAEFSLPNMSAYAQHVLKMSDALNKTDKDLMLIIPYCNDNYTFQNIKLDYNLKTHFQIKSIFKKKITFNFFWRIFFSIKIFFLIKNQKNFNVISRSIIPSIILAILNIKNCLEIHTEMTGLTKFFFKLSKLKFVNKNLSFIVLNKKLIEILNLNKSKTIILRDAVDISDYKVFPKKRTLKNTCAYAGSLGPGKGLDIIIQLAKDMPLINFHVYGNLNTIKNKKTLNKIPKNLVFKGYIKYSDLNKVLMKYKVLLMPYEKQVGVLIKNISVENYFSPLKMFDYMASGRIIIASKLEVYKDILKNNINSFLVDPYDYKNWKKKILLSFKNNNYFRLGDKAYKDLKKYTWNERAQKINEFLCINR